MQAKRKNSAIICSLKDGTQSKMASRRQRLGSIQKKPQGNLRRRGSAAFVHQMPPLVCCPKLWRANSQRFTVFRRWSLPTKMLATIVPVQRKAFEFNKTYACDYLQLFFYLREFSSKKNVINPICCNEMLIPPES